MKQVRSTAEVIKWFKDRNKLTRSFTSFDVVSFYPSISEELLDEALDWAADVTCVSNFDKKVIKESCKNAFGQNQMGPFTM